MSVYRKKDNGEFGFSRRFWVYTIIATMFIVWIGYRTQMTANRVEEQAVTTREFSAQTSECLNTVLDTLKARTQINIENDEISQAERTIVFNLLRDLSAPPPEIKSLPADSPVRQKWTEELVIARVNEFAVQEAKAEGLKSARAQIKYPEPSCGLEAPE